MSNENETQRTWTEAPASATVKTFVKGKDWMITLRADNGKELFEKIDLFNEWLNKYAAPSTESELDDLGAGVRYEPIEQPSAQPKPKAVTAMNPTSGNSTKEVKVIHAVKMENAPRTDGKTDLKFFEVNHKWPDITVTRTPESLEKMLSDYFEGPLDFSKVWAIDFECAVEYTDSDKLNKNNKPYKDMQRIVPMYA